MPLRRALADAARGARTQAGFSLAELLVVIVILAMMMGAVFVTLQVSQRTYTRATASEDVQVAARAAIERLASDLRVIGSFYWGATNAGAAITAFSASAISFWGDVDADTMAGGADATLAAAANIPSTSVTVSAATGFTQNEIVYLGNGPRQEVALISSCGATAPNPCTSTTLNLAGPPASSGWTRLVRSFPAGSLARSVEQVTWTFTPGVGGALGTLRRTTPATGTEDILLNSVVSFSMIGYNSNGVVITNPAGIRAIDVSLAVRGSEGIVRTLRVRVQLRAVQVG